MLVQAVPLPLDLGARVDDNEGAVSDVPQDGELGQLHRVGAIIGKFVEE